MRLVADEMQASGPAGYGNRAYDVAYLGRSRWTRDLVIGTDSYPLFIE